MTLEPEVLRDVAARFGTPVFAYDLTAIGRRLDLLEEVFGPRLRPSYAVKANPHRAVLEFLEPRVGTLDISSVGEAGRAIAAGWPARRLSFTGPAKRPQDLSYAVERGIGWVVVESVREAEQLSGIAEGAGRSQDILVRISPRKVPRGFGVRMTGRSTQFGIDEEQVPAALRIIGQLPALRLAGFHVFSGSQCLDAAAVSENFAIMARLFRRFSRAVGLAPQRLVFGSGFGIPYHDDTSPLAIEAVAAASNPLFEALHAEPRFRECALSLELGRWLVGEAGIYLTSVVSRKESRGTSIGVCDGGMHHHLGACGHLGSVIHRNYRMFRIPARAHPPAGPARGPSRAFDLVGPLCTTIDTLGHGVLFEDLEPGDLIAIHCSGAYARTASPGGFISHEPAREVAVREREGGGYDLQLLAEEPGP